MRACGKKSFIPHEDLASLSQATMEEYPRLILGVVKSMLSGPSKNDYSCLYSASDLQRLWKPSPQMRETCGKCNGLAKDCGDFMDAYGSHLPLHTQLQLVSQVEVNAVRSLQAFARVTCIYTC